MPHKIIVAGSGSFIAQHWRGMSALDHLHVGRHGLDGVTACASDVIVNCATPPEFKTAPYKESIDYDLAAARLAADVGARFVMLSTRKVYAPQAGLVSLTESSTVGPVDRYGENKLQSEERIQSLLGERCIILRIANVYGNELGRRSFFGLAMTRLKTENRIVLDVSPFTARDFIPVQRLGVLLDAICNSRIHGVYNVGSGVALPLGRIAQWLIQGYGRGALEIVDVSERDAFVLDVSKLRESLGINMPIYNFEPDIRALGQHLNNE